MKGEKLQKAILKELQETFPNIDVSVTSWEEDPSRQAITFVDASFIKQYPLQRYRNLLRAFSEGFFEEHLQNTIWFELAPDEKKEDLDMPPDQETIERVKLGVLESLNEHRFFHALADIMGSDPKKTCHNDFAYSKRLLMNMGLSESDQYIFLHVFLYMKANCDCEILTRVVGLEV